ncbi:expressed unknown protein [Seminavis robusta]|uniref:Lcl C-terminal domain-containing protein n=1 Tax=Seminavis robusta TaxID=568900 RepID=A0A9N8DMJ1_9STRA|nr:expressed unknown protein [Seminavis robusta]|eukprot:Sro138_g064660.1 n/a (489) ;mRNA; f:30440-32010
MGSLCMLGFFLIFSVLVVAGNEVDDVACNANQVQACHCPGNGFDDDASDHPGGMQFCLPDESGWTDCAPCLWYEEWCDIETNLCWQDPPKDSNVPSKHGGVTVHDAMRYCEELAFGGHYDWRLPTLTELRSIIDGVGMTELMQLQGLILDDLCPITEGSTVEGMTMVDVILCTGRLNSFECPGSGGCCWNENLQGTCNTIDPASTTHYLEFWSSTPAADDPENWYGFVFFDTGTVGFNHALSFGEVRCVRDNDDISVLPSNNNNPPPQPLMTIVDSMCALPVESCFPGQTRNCSCTTGRDGMMAVTADGAQRCVNATDSNNIAPLATNDDSMCFGHCQCSSFQESPEPVDVCDQCDQVNVTVRVPNRLETQPYMLAVFLYKYGTLDFRPPDVGVQENEIRYPDIDVDKPITMTIPGCSYYRDRCMEGEYFLSIYLKMNEGRFPGIPEPFDDYFYADGRNEDPIVLTTGNNQTIELDVTVEPFIMSMLP